MSSTAKTETKDDSTTPNDTTIKPKTTKKKKKKKNTILYQETAVKYFDGFMKNKRYNKGINLSTACSIFKTAWELPENNGLILPSRVLRHFKQVLPKKPKQNKKKKKKTNNTKSNVNNKTVTNTENNIEPTPTNEEEENTELMRARTMVNIKGINELNLNFASPTEDDSNTISSITFQLLRCIYDKEQVFISGYCRESTHSYIPDPIVNYFLLYAFCRCHMKDWSMEKLKERRLELITLNNLLLTFDVEQIMLEKAATSQWNIKEHTNKMLFDQDALREIFNHWIAKKKLNKFRDKIVESTKKCIKVDNIYILKIILYYCDYHKHLHRNLQRNNEFIEFINEAAKYGAIDCIRLLLKSPHKTDWSEQKRPAVLYNAVRYHPENIEMIKFIIEKLQTLELTFICDDVMKQAIKYDLVEIAKIIVENRWHKINESDEKLAKRINLNCHLYFKERTCAIHLNEADVNNNENILDWDDDEWQEDDDNWENDDDWKNADD